MERPTILLATKWFCIAAVLVVLGALPSIIAYRRGHPKRGAILILNVLLGWTVIGWIVALVWSLMGFEKISEPAAPVSIQERSIANVERLANDILQLGLLPPQPGAIGVFDASFPEGRQDSHPEELLLRHDRQS